MSASDPSSHHIFYGCHDCPFSTTSMTAGRGKEIPMVGDMARGKHEGWKHRQRADYTRPRPGIRHLFHLAVFSFCCTCTFRRLGTGHCASVDILSWCRPRFAFWPGLFSCSTSLSLFSFLSVFLSSTTWFQTMMEIPYRGMGTRTGDKELAIGVYNLGFAFPSLRRLGQDVQFIHCRSARYPPT